jgi:FKBP-type peptidyl-prolyl cis-trans isomerase
MKFSHIATLATALLSSTLLFAEDAKPAGGMASMDAMSGMDSMEKGMASMDAMSGMDSMAKGMAGMDAMSGMDSMAAAKSTLSEAAKLSYSFGHSIGETIKQQNVEVDFELMVKGIKDAMSGSTDLLVSADEVKEILVAYQQKKREEMMKAQAEAQMKASVTNMKKGEAFLAENAKKEGVVTLASGLQYKVLVEGKADGKMPKETDTVTTHYRGTTVDGEEFDSSYSRNEPTSFTVNGVIAGWTEALQLMKEGAKWQLFIPAKLAYGERGAGGKIGPSETLIFEVELISVDTK